MAVKEFNELVARIIEPSTVRKNLTMSSHLAAKLDELAMRKGTNLSEVVRRALDLYITVDEAMVKEHMSVGLVHDPKKLDTRIVGL